jgi:hypothetical protein
MRLADKPAVTAAVIVGKNSRHRLIRPAVGPVVGMAGFGSAIASDPVVEMAGFAVAAASDPAVEMAGFGGRT